MYQGPSQEAGLAGAAPAGGPARRRRRFSGSPPTPMAAATERWAAWTPRWSTSLPQRARRSSKGLSVRRAHIPSPQISRPQVWRRQPARACAPRTLRPKPRNPAAQPGSLLTLATHRGKPQPGARLGANTRSAGRIICLAHMQQPYSAPMQPKPRTLKALQCWLRTSSSWGSGRRRIGRG